MALACLTFAVPANAQTTVALFDPGVTVGSGASIADTGGRVMAALEGLLVPSRLVPEEGAGRRALNISYRALRLFAFDIPQENWLRVANHEVFGHGARLRERFSGPIDYSLPLPQPYGDGGGATFYLYDREPTLHEILAVTAGGMEASEVAASRVALRTIGRGTFEFRDAVRYLAFQYDTLAYLLRASDRPQPEGNDVADYLTTHAELADAQGGRQLSARTVRQRARLALANPLMVSAVYTVGAFLVRGDDRVAVPMLRLGSVGYLPLVRYYLTPFGGETAIDSLFRGGDRAGILTVRTGTTTGRRAWGAGISSDRVAARAGIAFGGSLDVWSQPRLSLDGESLESGGSFGVSARAVASVPLGPTELVLEGRYKTRGYVPGEPLAGGPGVRIGVGLELN